jgi:TIR domain
MTASADSGGIGSLRKLAQLSILLAMASLLATAGALMRLPHAAASGQWIVVTAGAIVSVSAFVFGMLISLRTPLARPVGFAAVAMLFPTAALFGLLAYVVPEAAWFFGLWTILLLTYAILATHRLVRWPTGDWRDQTKSRLAIFISYRRGDSQETAGRIHDHLLRAFEEERLFLDVDDQAAGEDYCVAIGRALERADVVLAVIGTQWLTVVDRDGRRRLDEPDDMVRIELETALHRNLRLIPVLVEGATMPRPEDVPASLQPLCYRTAARVRPDPDFNPDIERLVLALRSSEEKNPRDERVRA